MQLAFAVGPDSIDTALSAHWSQLLRTSYDGLQRLAPQPRFTGPVQPGENYVLVDDTLT